MYPTGYIHVDLAEVWTEQGRLYLFVAIDRVTKFAFAELHQRATRLVAAEFLRRLIARIPYAIHTVLTDNGFQFAEPRASWTVKEIRQLLGSGQRFRAHADRRFKKPAGHVELETAQRYVHLSLAAIGQRSGWWLSVAPSWQRRTLLPLDSLPTTRRN